MRGWEPAGPSSSDISTPRRGFPDCLSVKINNNPHTSSPPGPPSSGSLLSSYHSHSVMTSSPWPQGSLGPASLASATNVNLTSECRSPEPRYSQSYLLTHRSGAPLSYLSYLQTVQTLTTSGPRSLSSDSDSVAPTVSGSPPVSDIRKQRSGDENREGEPVVIG